MSTSLQNKTALLIAAAFSALMITAASAHAVVLPALQKTQISRINLCAPATSASIAAAGFVDTINNNTGAAGGDGLADNWGRVCAKPRNSSSGMIDAYLSTRYTTYPDTLGSPTSLNKTRQGSPVASVRMTFPGGSNFQPYYTRKPFCTQQAPQGASIKANCGASLIGTGWALVNTGQGLGEGGLPTPRAQLAPSPAPCSAESATNSNDWTMYSRTFATSGVLDCTPWSHLYNKVRVYQGIKPEGKTIVDKCSVVFVSENMASIVSFSGQLTGAGTAAERAAGKKCGNVLNVKLPALWGTGSYPGELLLGWTLADFRVILNAPNAFKSGATSCSAGKMKVRSQIAYSPRKFEDGKKVLVDGAGKPILDANGKQQIVADPTEPVRPAPVAFDGTTATAC